jgi:hypothetical protein
LHDEDLPEEEGGGKVQDERKKMPSWGFDVSSLRLELRAESSRTWLSDLGLGASMFVDSLLQEGPLRMIGALMSRGDCDSGIAELQLGCGYLEP